MNNTLSLPAVVLVSLTALLSGCMTFDYKPALYPLTPDRIAPLKVNGDIKYINNQPSTDIVSRTDAGHTWKFTYKQITDGFNKQLQNEVSSRSTSSSQPQKTIRSKVTALSCDRSLGSYVRNCSITVELTTGDGQTISIDSKQGSPIFNAMEGSYNGTIATAVIDALKNDKLLAYLAK